MWPNSALFNKLGPKLPYILLALFLIFGLYLRVHNIFHYHSFWADDGGGHIKYMETIYYESRLPSMSETYVAWHEPLYYLILWPWQKIGHLLGLMSLSWATSLNILIYGLFLSLVWKLSRLFGATSLVGTVNVALFSVLFIGVKLSAYINNELLAQTYILLLVYLFIKYDLLSANKLKKVFIWSLLLALGLWIKLTVYIVLLAVLLFYIFFLNKRRYLWKYILLVIILPLALNVPWLLYKKNNFNSYFTINIYEAKPRQDILSSDAWQYIFTINKSVFIDYPYWYHLPHSYFSILLSDSFGDYYNLFNDNTKIGELAPADKILVGNGRYTTDEYWQALLNTNRLALIFFIIWFLGFTIFIRQHWRAIIKTKHYYFFWLIVLVGGWAALLFQNIRLPYLEAGVLKGHFIYYTYPLLTIPAYLALETWLKNKWLVYTFFFLPILLYIYFAWRILLV